MSRIRRTVALLCLLSGSCLAFSAPASRFTHHTVSYNRDVLPLLRRSCYACHGNGLRLGGLNLEGRSGMLKGGDTGPAIVPGSAARSNLVKLISGEVPGKVMPARGPQLSPAEIATIRAWIDQGATFDTGLGKELFVPPLLPVHARLPTVRGMTNPVDRLLAPWLAARGLGFSAAVSDSAFARRVYMDIIGLLPTPKQLSDFEGDHLRNKRFMLVQSLLSNDRDYAENWLTFWNDMLRNDYTGTGYIDGGRTQITSWLYNALATNEPYNQFVAELVNPTPATQGFTNGIEWRGVVNASQTPQMQCAQNIAQVFMGANLKCASCHDSFINNWKLADSYGMASIYSERPLEMVRCDKPTGRLAPVHFMYPELGSINASAPRGVRLKQLADIITSFKDGRLCRTLVNRLWGKLMGRGIVEPQDDMDQRPWNADLLNWLAWDLAAHGYNVRRTIEIITTSRAYQLPATPLASEQTGSFQFRGPVIKRLNAEQYCDAIAQVTGVGQRSATPFPIDKGAPHPPLGSHARVLFDSGVMRTGSATVDVNLNGAKALALVVTDGGDGADYDWSDWIAPTLYSGGGQQPLTQVPWYSAGSGYGTVQIDKSVVGKALILAGSAYPRGIGTHANSIVTWMLPPNSTRLTAMVGPDSGAMKEGSGKTSVRFFVLVGDAQLIQSRAALTVANPLMLALGRPNRDVVVTERATAATTLQCLELTNGQTLDEILRQGAELLSQSGLSSRRVVGDLFMRALGRLPTQTEDFSAADLFRTESRVQAIQDLLWTVVMLPEFQLQY